MIVPFSHSGIYDNLTFHSCSTNGTRSSGFVVSHIIAQSIGSKTVAWELKTNNSLNGTPIQPGTGKVLTAWFTVGASDEVPYDQINIVESVGPYKPLFQSDCLSYRPFDLDYDDVCCVGIRGNVNADPGENVNILDLNFMVNRVFRSGPAPICAEEGDVNGDGISANILDLNFLVNLVFRSGPMPGSCN